MGFKAMGWASEQDVGGAAGKLILIMLASYSDAADRTFVGQKTLAKDCSISDRTVREWLDKLEADGWISRAPRRRDDGYRTSDMITLNRKNSPAEIAGEGQALVEVEGDSHRKQSPRSNLPDEPKKEARSATGLTESRWVEEGSAEWEAVRKLRGRSPPTRQQNHAGPLGWFLPVDEIGKAMAS